ncbi:MAG: PEP-CTERM sorting domain-containing protein [Planctomycetaceae bacterium]|nr:PEP-CTERM sorting domain-containing protein [Planctomycetaceae bacterium]
MMRAIQLAVACVAVLVATSEHVQAGDIHPLGEQTPGGAGWLLNDPSVWSRGWRFTANVTDIYVTELGLNTPIAGQDFQLDLWDVGTQTSLASVNAVSTGDWHFESISPVQLQQGNDYIVSLFSDDGDTYYFGSSIPASWFPTGDIQYVTMQAHNSPGNPFPTAQLGGFQYGVPDIGYQIGSPASVPEPSSFALFGIGACVAGAGVARGRKSKKQKEATV